MPYRPVSGHPAELSATEAAALIRNGSLTSEALVSACLDQIAATDQEIKAWEHILPEKALRDAQDCDRAIASGEETGPLCGVPVGIKDIIDVAGYPTEHGSPIFTGHRPSRDARLVERLRAAGAVILGKTVTTEIAFLHPAKTRNPHDLMRTPGGSSSGSAAAVAAYQVPLSLGSQTNGSVIRPAAFCGVYGFKPTRGSIPVDGVLQTSKTLDQVGCFARSVEDVALVASVLSGQNMGWHGSPRLETTPKLAYLDMPFADRLSDDAKAQFDALVAALGSSCKRMPAPRFISTVINAQRSVHLYEINLHLGDRLRRNPELVSSTLKPLLSEGEAISDADYHAALAALSEAAPEFENLFSDVDAVISPSTTGTAPLASSGTGDPIFCTAWTAAGMPALTLPLLTGADGLPLGVQLAAPAGRDRHLLHLAQQLTDLLDQPNIRIGNFY
ncbi:amidase [Roseibium sp. RKSG952]|uniref:amidase n=1 Tax=Roseibium sp. RKSG952 TaxID=2529384 RepID=UPI0012BBCFC0|nr:amidase [Roseibium sp. RKSG952]MTH99764.1 amidase [Roseibium sp. RKSG952]